MKKNESTQYGVARGESVLDDELFPTLADARAKLARVEDGMRTAALEPDVRLVAVDVTISYSRPRAAQEDVAATELDEVGATWTEDRFGRRRPVDGAAADDVVEVHAGVPSGDGFDAAIESGPAAPVGAVPSV